jgi:hypothetical protein
MKNSMTFRSISQLTDELSGLLNNNHETVLTLEQLENANLMAREISERLIVLRHKAYEKLVRPENTFQSELQEPIISESTKDEEWPTSVDKSDELDTPFFQMSLIDAIEEASSHLVTTNTEAEVENDFNADTVTEEITNTFNELAQEDAELEIHSKGTNMAQPTEEKIENTFNTLNANLSQLIPSSLSLADKHQLERIDDLKRAITLNQRFQFSRELFKGNNQEYEVAIDRLNNSTREEALMMLQDLRSRFDWHEESSAALDFFGLVERRYPSL